MMERKSLHKKPNLNPFHYRRSSNCINSLTHFVLLNDAEGNIWRKYTTYIHDPQQEASLKTIINWRQTTSMPVLKAKSLQIEPISSYPKKVIVFIEHIFKDFNELTNLKLNQSLYLLNQTLLGFNAILYKFGTTSISLQNCGINSRGECRVWVDEQFCLTNSQMGLDDIGLIAEELIMLIMDMTAKVDKIRLGEILQEVKKKKINSFSSLHSLIRRVAQGQKVVFPVRLKDEFYSPIKERNKNMVNYSGNIPNSDNKSRSKTRGKNKRTTFGPEYKQNRRNAFNSKENIQAIWQSSQKTQTTRGFSIPKNKIQKQFELSVVPSDQSQHTQPQTPIKFPYFGGFAKKESEKKLKNSMMQQIFKQNSWQQKLKGLMWNNDLKESITYGAEESEKLDLCILGNFGREISRSIIPADRQ